MKLYIRRSQEDKKGVLGGHKGVTFDVEFRLELTPEENALVEKYKYQKEALTTRQDTDGDDVAWHTVSDLMNGVSVPSSSITTILHNEQLIKDACENLKQTLDVMSTFGGEDVVDI